MSRFSGLPEPVRTSEPENGSRIAKIRAAASEASGSEGRRFDELLTKRASAQTTAASREATAVQTQTPAPVAKSAPVPAPKPAASAPAPKRDPWKVPKDVEAQGPAFADAYRSGFEKVGAQVARLRNHPAAQGRLTGLMKLVAEGHSDAEIIAQLPSQRSDADLRAVRDWDDVHAEIRAARAGGAIPEPTPDPKANHGWDAIHAEIRARRATR